MCKLDTTDKFSFPSVTMLIDIRLNNSYSSFQVATVLQNIYEGHATHFTIDDFSHWFCFSSNKLRTQETSPMRVMEELLEVYIIKYD